MIKSKQNGFTLIELVVVIVILGILAAFAVPRFMGMEGEARASTVKSMGGSLMAAATMARAKCQAQSCGAALTVDNQNIVMVNGYPNNASIRLLLQSTEGFSTSPTTQDRRFSKVGAAGGNCWVQYNQAANVNSPPTLTYAAVVNAGGLPGTAGFNAALSDACR